jgi:hypothetical protein
MNIELAVMHKYPHATPEANFVVKKDVDKQFILEWRMSEEKPSEEDLKQWWLEYKRDEKHKALRNRVNEAIVSSFFSVTTGHYYDFDVHDQANFTQQMLLFVNNPALIEVDWKTTDAGIVRHTKDEFFAVVEDANSHKRSNLSKFWTKENALKIATTLEEVEAIQWEDTSTI